ncbi:hypothetical protein Tco_0748800 [Tanacetum coccineum]|uniref:Uncharacterized protein n=1 Tax=Tanacetum coccineum TaxID=301880 RepID=A0ABQ4YWM8_9ASTR
MLDLWRSNVRHFLWQNLRKLYLDLLSDPCRSVDGGIVALVVGGGVDVDCYGGGVKNDKDCGMTVENTGEELELTETGKRIENGAKTGEQIDDEYERDCEIKIKQLLQDYSGLDIEMRKKERVLMEEKYLAASQRIKSICNDEDDSIPLRDIIARYSPSVAITSSPPVLSTREPKDSLIMGDEHLDTIPEKESDRLIKSSVENLVPILSEPEVTSDNESECDMPVCYDFTTFSNSLFDSNDDFTSSDDESLSDEDVPMENFKIYSNSRFDDEEIISPKNDPHYFNVESNLIESLLNRDILIDSSPKFDYLLKEFSGELAHIEPIPPGIEKADFDLKKEIRLVENLLYDNSSPRPPEDLNLEIADTILESLSPSPILVKDNDSHMEEIDLFLATNDSMPSGIEDDDYDSEGDIRFLEELLSNDSPPLPKIESSNLDHFNDPLSPHPPSEPPDVEIGFDVEPDAGVCTNKVVGDISEHNVLIPNLLPTRPTFCPVFDLLLPFSSENEVWICQISQEISQKRTRERMSDQEAKELKAEARKIMPQPSTKSNCSFHIQTKPNSIDL